MTLYLLCCFCFLAINLQELVGGEKKRMTISLVGRSKEKDAKHKEKEKEKEKETEVKPSKVRVSLSPCVISLILMHFTLHFIEESKEG